MPLFFTKPKIWLLIKLQGAYAYSKFTNSWRIVYTFTGSEIPSFQCWTFTRGQPFFRRWPLGTTWPNLIIPVFSFTSLVDSGQNCIYSVPSSKLTQFEPTLSKWNALKILVWNFVFEICENTSHFISRIYIL